MALWRIKNEVGKLLLEGQITIDANARLQPLFRELDALLVADLSALPVLTAPNWPSAKIVDKLRKQIKPLGERVRED
jgi:hypothetical protein